MNLFQKFFGYSGLARFESEFKIDEFIEAVFSALSDGAMIYDKNFKILAFNETAGKIFNLSPKDVIGKKFSPNDIKNPSLRLVTQAIFPSLAPSVVKHSESGIYPQTIDLSFDSPKTELRVITNKLFDKNGGLFGFIKIIVDRTREFEILESKNEFISTAAHQLRTPLTGINWALEILLKEPLNESQKRLVESAGQTSAYILKIVNDLLDVSKIEEGRFGYRFSDVNIADFIESIIKEVNETIKESTVKIYFQRPRENIVVKADDQKLGIALFNLLDNAVHYNVPNGEVIISVEKLKDKPYIQISVKDTGIGIPAEDAKKIFSRFFRAENAVKSSPNGSGLGLYIVKNIIKRHGGDIWLESEINRGSVFHFTLPTDPKLIPEKEISYGEDK